MDVPLSVSGVLPGRPFELGHQNEGGRSTFDDRLSEGGLDEVGRKIHTMTGLLGEVVETTADSVTVDFDPDRSGEVLIFDVEVLEVE